MDEQRPRDARDGTGEAGHGPRPDGLREGLPVYMRSGGHMGEVKTLAEGCFKVDRQHMPDIWLRDAAVADVRDGRVILTAFSHELDDFIAAPP